MNAPLPPKELYLTQLNSTGFDRIASHIAKSWSTNDLCEYFISLLIDKRNDNRQGFDDETYLAILKLYTIYCFENKQVDKWADTFFK